MLDSKKQFTFARNRAINKLFHIEWYIGWFIGQYRAIYRPIFQISAVFCCKWYDERFSHIVSAVGKKGDIGRYLGRIDWYLKQGMDHVLESCMAFILSTSQLELIVSQVQLLHEEISQLCWAIWTEVINLINTLVTWKIVMVGTGRIRPWHFYL